MKMKRSLFLIALIACTQLAAQSGKKITELSKNYFENALSGTDAKVPDKRFSFKDLQTYRQAVWTAWREANLGLDEERLPDLRPLSGEYSSAWHIPERLEPDANMPFYYGTKGEKPEEGYPLFVYLHGSGPKDAEWATGLKLCGRFDDAPCVYFIPQIPNENEWYRWWQKGKQYVWERLLRQVLLSNDINPDRIYLFGISEGGYGSQRLASFYADYLAAAGPMAGGEPLKNAPAENLCATAFSLLTGAEDWGFYREKLTRYTADALDSLQSRYPEEFIHRVELIPGKGHHIDYSLTTPWLSRFERNASPKHFVWEDFEMDGIRRSGFYNLLVRERPDPKRRTRYEMTIQGNEVRISVDNIDYRTTETDTVYGIELKFARTFTPATSGRFTLFLDERLVDLAKPVRVVVNGREVFKGKIRLNLSALLCSASAFFDPRRLYPAAVEVSL